MSFDTTFIASGWSRKRSIATASSSAVWATIPSATATPCVRSAPWPVLVEVAALVLGAREHRLHRLVRAAPVAGLAVAVLQVEPALGERLSTFTACSDGGGTGSPARAGGAAQAA